MAPLTIDHSGQPLLVFEASAADYYSNNAVGYWGRVNSSIDWCERNYVVSFFVAEYFNTLSSALMVVLGLVGIFTTATQGLELRFTLCHAGVVLIGLGSAAFHGCLSHVGQQLDETPMIVGAALWLWALAFQDPHFEARHPALVHRSVWASIVLCTAFAVVHYVCRFTVGFQVLTFVLVMAGIYRLRFEWPKCADAAAMRVGYRYYHASGWPALLLWICDQQLCAHLHELPFGVPNPQLHAFWHAGQDYKSTTRD